MQADEPGATPPPKNLIFPGEVFEVAGRTAFLFTPAKASATSSPRPWILYSPTLPAYPDKAEAWMHERFLAAGVAVAGVGGIYPVYDWWTYPGLAKAAVAYGLTPEQLASQAEDLCPIERINVAAHAGVPFCIIHGDAVLYGNPAGFRPAASCCSADVSQSIARFMGRPQSLRDRRPGGGGRRGREKLLLPDDGQP